MVSTNTVEYCRCIFSYDFLNNVCFSVACFIVRIQHIMSIIRKCVLISYMASGQQQILVKFWGNQNVYVGFRPWGSEGGMWRWSVPLSPVLFEGQLQFHCSKKLLVPFRHILFLTPGSHWSVFHFFLQESVSGGFQVINI